LASSFSAIKAILVIYELNRIEKIIGSKYVYFYQTDIFWNYQMALTTCFCWINVHPLQGATHESIYHRSVYFWIVP